MRQSGRAPSPSGAARSNAAMNWRWMRSLNSARLTVLSAEPPRPTAITHGLPGDEATEGPLVSCTIAVR